MISADLFGMLWPICHDRKFFVRGMVMAEYLISFGSVLEWLWLLEQLIDVEVPGLGPGKESCNVRPLMNFFAGLGLQRGQASSLLDTDR